MSKIKLLSIAVALLLVMNLGIVSFFVFGQPGHLRHGRPGSGREGPKRVIIERLHFDDKQVGRYQDLIDKHRHRVTELEGQIRDVKNGLYLTLADEQHAGKDSLENRLGLLHREMESVHYNHFADIRRLCKPEQLQYFNKLTEELAFFFSPGKNLPPPPKD